MHSISYTYSTPIVYRLLKSQARQVNTEPTQTIVIVCSLISNGIFRPGLRISTDNWTLTFAGVHITVPAENYNLYLFSLNSQLFQDWKLNAFEILRGQWQYVGN